MSLTEIETQLSADYPDFSPQQPDSKDVEKLQATGVIGVSHLVDSEESKFRFLTVSEHETGTYGVCLHIPLTGSSDRRMSVAELSDLTRQLVGDDAPGSYIVQAGNGRIEWIAAADVAKGQENEIGGTVKDWVKFYRDAETAIAGKLEAAGFSTDLSGEKDLMVRAGEVVKLSPQEMEALMGGGFWKALGLGMLTSAVGVGAGAVSCGLLGSAAGAFMFVGEVDAY